MLRLRSSLTLLKRNGFRPWHFVALALLCGGAVAAGWPAWVDLFQQGWKDPEDTHVLLVPVVVAWLVIARRVRLRKVVARNRWVGPIVIALGWAMFSYGEARMVESVWYLGATATLVGAVLTIGGTDLVRYFLPAFGVLVFLIPIPGSLRAQIALPLQTAMAATAEWLCITMGFPVERLGNVLEINGQPVAIEEACNGLRMVFSLILVTYAFAFSTPLRQYVRVILLIVSPLLAIACNVIRLIPTIILYGYAGDSMGDMFHDIAGWAMLFVALILLIGTLRLVDWLDLPVVRLDRAGRSE
ncbi:MAG: exosortase/archaeosortase family protein [Planctomycetota bacterium]